MFNFFSNQTSLPEPVSPDPVFVTEKELLLYVIENEIDPYGSKTYSKHALPEWKAQYSKKKDYVNRSAVWEKDRDLILELAKTSDDKEILRAIYDNHRDGFLLMYISDRLYPELYLNVNLPDDLVDNYINSPFFPGEASCYGNYRLSRMLKVGFNSTLNTKIQKRIDGIDSEERKKKADKTKNKLKAFLITTSAANSVLKGKSIDDVVADSITEDVDEDVLNYINKLLGEKRGS